MNDLFTFYLPEWFVTLLLPVSLVMWAGFTLFDIYYLIKGYVLKEPFLFNESLNRSFVDLPSRIISVLLFNAFGIYFIYQLYSFFWGTVEPLTINLLLILIFAITAYFGRFDLFLLSFERKETDDNKGLPDKKKLNEENE